MALDLMPLIDDFNAYFLGLYHQAAAPASDAAGAAQTPGSPAGGIQTDGAVTNGTKAAIGPFLAFANLGTPITPDMFMLKDGTLYDGLAVEQFSTLANALPTIQDGSIMGAGLLTVDGLYNLMLQQAQPVSASDMEALGAVKRDAQKAFDATLPGLTPGVGEFHPAVPTPTDWPFPTAAAAWSSRVFEQTQTIAVAPPPSPSPVPRPPIPQAVAAARGRAVAAVRPASRDGQKPQAVIRLLSRARHAPVAVDRDAGIAQLVRTAHQGG